MYDPKRNYNRRCLGILISLLVFISACSVLPEGATPLNNIPVKMPDGGGGHVSSLVLLERNSQLVLHGRLSKTLKHHGPQSSAMHLDILVLNKNGDVIETNYARLAPNARLFNHELTSDVSDVSSVEVKLHMRRGGHI